MDTAEEIISQTADKSIEITQAETQGKKKIEKLKGTERNRSYKTISMV